jgi:predicted AAA+ superfamily ATPase
MKSPIRTFISTLQKRFSEPAPLIQILIGPRQVGKTTGVLQFLETYQQPYHYVSADALLTTDTAWILDQWQQTLHKGNKALLVIDEIQKVVGWSETIKKLWDTQQRKNTQIDVLLLGSSSLALSQGASESLAGRFELIPVYHWGYHESNALHPMTLDLYLQYGGYPKSYDYLDDIERWANYVKGSVIDRVIDKDILSFATVKKPALFRQTFEILCNYPSQEISFRKLLGQLQDQGNTDLVKYYISLFEGAFLFKSLQKYSRQAFRLKSSSPKIIPLCPCFYQVFSHTEDKKSFVFESTVGATLLQISEQVYYWREGNAEVDFVVSWQKKLFAIEVKSGKKRPATGLIAFCKAFPEAIPIIISRENYLDFVQSPSVFLQRLS